MQIINPHPVLLFALILATGVNAIGQKLPGIQQASVRAPAEIKIDGKPTEWDNKFQAYNNATEIFYTLANDDEYLYLTVQATHPEIIKKIMLGGITLSVNKTGKKVEKDNPSVTYPVFGLSDININLKEPMESASPQEREIFAQTANKMLGEKSKYVMTMGIKGLDTLISVYNEDGVRVAQAFDTKINYTCELGISLKKLGLSIDNNKTFAYHIVVNGINPYILNNKTINKAYNDGFAAGRAAAGRNTLSQGEQSGGSSLGGLGQGIGPAGNNNPGQKVPTDFWGQYTLAQK